MRARGPTPEACLDKARLARTSVQRAKYAQRGLEQGRADATTRSMLLRQLYLAELERRHFDEAIALADQMVALGVMTDVALQDGARACVAMGRTDDAVLRLRRASRIGPASRRSFHLWTLGSVLLLSGSPPIW